MYDNELETKDQIEPKHIYIYIPHKEVCLCCFLTVSCPIYAILAMFHRLGFSPTKTRPKKKVVTNLCLRIGRRFSFLENVNLDPNIEP